MFFLSFLSTVLTVLILNAHVTPHAHSLDIFFGPLILQSGFFLRYYIAIFPKARVQPIFIHQIYCFTHLCKQKLIRKKAKQNSHLL